MVSFLKMNFKNLIREGSSFSRINKYLWEFYKHINEPIYTEKLRGFDQAQAMN